MMENFVRYMPGVIYPNLVKIINMRKVETDHKQLATNELAKELNNKEYIYITGTRRGRTVYFVMLAPGSKYVNSSPEFRKLYNLIGIQGEEPYDIMFVSEKSLSNQVIKEIEKKEADVPGIYIECYTYEKLVVDITKRVDIPLHRFPEPNEMEYFRQITFVRDDGLTKIPTDDPAIIWLGAKPGEIVIVEKFSENNAIMPTPCQVTKAAKLSGKR